MRFRILVLAGLAALAVSACGKKDGAAKGGVAAQVSAGSPLETPYRLGGGEAIDVDALFSLFPEGRRPTYASAKFDQDLGATVVTGLRFVEPGYGEDAEPDITTVERAELYGVDMAAINRVKAGAAAIDAPFEKIFDKVRLFGVKPERADEPPTIGAIELDQLRLRHGIMREDEKENAARFFNSFDLAGIYFKDLVVEATEGEGGAISFAAPDLRFVGIGGGKLGAVIAKNMEYEIDQPASAALAQSMGPAAGVILGSPLKGFVAPDNQRVKIKVFEWRGIDLSGWMGYGLQNEKPPLTANNLISLGSLKATDMETFIAGRRGVYVAETTLSATEFSWLIPSKIHSETKGAAYDFTAYTPETEEKAIAVLKKHGLDKVRGGGKLDWDWDASKGGASLKTSFDTTGLADFVMNLDLAGLELKKINALMEAGDKDAAMKTGAFKAFNLKLSDEKLLDAIYDIAALQMGGTGDDLRQSAPAMVRLSGAAAATANPRISDYVDAIANFLAQGGTIEISAKPASSVPLQSIAAAGQAAPETLPDLIDLKVTHTKPK